MKYKKTIILLALVVFLLSIAGVSASEIGDTLASEDTNTIGLSVDNDIIEDNLQTSEENEALASTDYDEDLSAQTDTRVLGEDSAKYSELAEEISHSGNIILTHKNYTYDEGETITISEANKVIDGNGAVIDMNGSTIRAFSISGSGVTIKNLTIKNANYNGNGGAIYFTSSGTVTNCNFTNNTANEDGGAVYFDSTGTVTNCNFTNNTANEDGGAVYFYDEGSVSNCNFTGNTATYNGGAVYFWNQGSVENCNFSNNSARDGGAVYFDSTGTVTNCNFTGNTATSQGGAIRFTSTGTVTNCNFADNTATYGGAVFFYDEGTVTNCNFTNNTAEYGGAVSFWHYGSVSNCNFTGNTATYNGGAINMNSGTVSNCNFTGNTANYGGAINMGSGTVSYCNFVDNKATGDYSWGGAIYMYYGSVSNCNFTGNTATDGGAVYIYDDGEVTNCNFTDNTADYGGAIMFNGSGTVSNCNFTGNTAINGGAVYFYTGSVSNCNFTGNTAYNGGAVYFYNDGTVSNCNFTGNTANYGGGGAVYFSSTGSVSNCNFTNNTASQRGGAVYFYDEGTVSNCNFTNNSARYGGAIEFDVTGTVSNCNFTDNTATYGGAVYFDNTGSAINCNFTGNTANYYGGAIRMYSGSVSNCNFTNNQATGDDSEGGAIYFHSSGTVSNCNFEDNNVSGNGGAVSFAHDKGSVENCNFTNNSASMGGAVYFSSPDSVAKRCDFVGNNAIGDGGAVYFASDECSAENCNFTSNSALKGGAVYFKTSGYAINCSFASNNVSGDGGAVYAGNEGIIMGCNFTDNSASGVGGAARIYDGLLMGCNFTGNTAVGDGGAVFFDAWGSVGVSSFACNTGRSGGALWVLNAQIMACNFEKNNASENGGAVFFDSGDLEECNFTANTASNHGGAICFDAYANPTNCSFAGNTALMGGAAYFSRGAAVHYCNFTGNIASNGSALYFEYTPENNFVHDSTFLENTADAQAIDIIKNDDNITIIFTGNDNLLNAIYSRNDAEVDFTNVKYWGANGITTVSATLSGSNKAAGQNITVGIVVNDEIVLNQVYVTDENGTIVLNINAGENYYITARHDTDSYYTEAEKAISNNTKFNVNVTSQTTNNKTVNITAKSNIYSEFMPGKLLFILPNGTSINATYGANGTWWAVHTFEDYDVYRLSASYVGLNGVTVNKGTITITKADSKITLENITLNYGENINLTITTEGATGITAKIDNVDVDVENKFTVLISGLNGGNHTLTVSTVPDEDHLSVTETATIIVNKLPTEIILANETLDLKVMDIGHILAKLTPEGGGNLTYVSSDVSVVTVDDKGNVNAIGGGNATIIVSFAGNDNYTAAKDAVVTVCVSKLDTAIDVDASTDENNVIITAAVDKNASGLIKFNIGGKVVYVDVNGGEAVYDIILPSGNYTVEATYVGDNKFNSNTTSKEFTIAGHVKKNTPITAEAKPGVNRVTITVNVDENATGFVNIKFADNEFNVALNDGAGSLTVNLPANSYSVDVTYLGDVNFNENMTELSFTVADPVKENTPISLDVSSVENNVTFTVDVSSDATGIVRFEVSGAEEYTVYADVIEGQAVMGDVLSVGDYTVVATYLGDSRFNSNITSESFTIKGHVKKDTQISADAKVSGNRVTITVDVDENATGFVGLKLVGSTVYVPVENGVASYVATFDAGSYNVVATYLGDDDFNENTTRVLFTVVEAAKENTFITLNVSSVENNATFTVDVSSDATGIVRFEVSGAEEYTVYVDVLNGKAVMDDVLLSGEYTVVATYMGDSRFNSNATSGSFNVKGYVKKDTQISADVKVSGNRVSIAVNVDANATGFVNIKFVDNEFNVALNDGAGSLTVNLPANSYSVDVTYLGDDNFNGNMTELSFTVADPVKENTTIALVVYSVENNVTFTVNLNSDATGIVRFEVSGAEEYTVYADVIEGQAVMGDVLSVGDYTVVATYLGDSRFNSNITSESFTIKGHVKKDTQISADAKVSGNRVTITVDVDENATGFVGLKLVGSTVYVPVENGVATYINTFATGSYNVEVTYTGDDDFNENSTRVLFTVVEAAKENTFITLNVSSVENNATFTVDVSSDATGIVRFEVSGVENYIVYADVIDGKAVMEDVLMAGDYRVVATYMGDSRFNSNATSGSFTVKGHVKKDTQISADVKVSGNRVSIAVNVDANATGFVNIKFVDNEFNVALNDGAGSLTVNLPANSYNVDVAYLGDYNFNENMTKLSFTVEDPVKENTPISLDVSSVENNVTFTVNVNSDASGIVRFEVSGPEVYTVYVDVTDGKAVMEDVLSVGDYTVVATYLGDGIFNSNITSESFTIKGHVKKDTQISADAKVSGNRVTITVNVDENATGFVGLKLLGSTIYVPVENGVATYINTFATGSYNVEVSYVGDDNFNENSTRVLFTVVEAAKDNTDISLNVSSFENNVTFIVDVSPDATGIVKFEVSGTEEYTVYADVVDGRAVMEDVLSAGDYIVVVSYMGDSKFNSNSTTTSFTILNHVKIDTPIKAVPTVDGNTVTITATVDSNATGFVTFGVLGQRFMIPVNDGKAVFTFDFASGTYAANVVYLGDDNFNNASTTATFTVIKQVVELKNTTLDVSVDSVENDVSIIAKVDSLASGLVEFVIDGEAVYIAVNNGEAAYEVVLPAGDYNVTVTYLGDDKFNPNSTLKAFTVVDHIKKNTTITSDVDVGGNNVILTVNVNKDARGFVKFTLDGENVFAEVVDGEAIIKIIVPAGDYAVNACYLGDNEFNENVTVISFTVDAPESSDVNINVPSDVKAGDDANVTVEIPDATGNVSVIVDGVEKVVSLVNGSAVVPLENVSAGDHSIVVIYEGDETHAPSYSVSDFTVADYIATKFANITVMQDLNVTAVLVDANGNPIANANITYTVGNVSNSTVTGADGSFIIAGTNDAVVTINYAGNGTYLATNTSIKFDKVYPVKQATAFVSSDFNQFACDYYEGERGGNFTFQLVDGNGKPIANKTIYIGYNGVTLNRTTDANGFASVQINLKNAGLYTFVLVFLGDEDYNATMAVHKVTIEKKTTSISATAKTFKATAKTKKYTVTLKTIKGSSIDGKTYLAAGKKVTIKVNGKTYSGKINAKGQVTFNLKLTKKGKYRAVIKFAGDTTYKAASKKVIITIK